MSKQGIILTIIAVVLLVGIAVGAVMLLGGGKENDLPAEGETTTEAMTATETATESGSDTSVTDSTEGNGEVGITENSDEAGSVPTQETPTQEIPTQETPTQETTTQETPTQEAPTQETPTQESMPPLLSFEEYDSMSGQSQREYMYSFPNLDAFFDWYNAAKEAYESTRDTIEFDGTMGPK